MFSIWHTTFIISRTTQSSTTEPFSFVSAIYCITRSIGKEVLLGCKLFGQLWGMVSRMTDLH